MALGTLNILDNSKIEEDIEALKVSNTRIEEDIEALQNPEFKQASSRSNINSKESNATILGKIKKYFTDIKSFCYNSLANNLTTSSSGSYALDAYQGKVLNDKINGLLGNMDSIYLTKETTVAPDGSIITKDLSYGTYLIMIWLSNYSGGSGWFGNNGSAVIDTSSTMYGMIPAGGCIFKVHTINASQTVGLWNCNGKSVSYGAGTCMFYMKIF